LLYFPGCGGVLMVNAGPIFAGRDEIGMRWQTTDTLRVIGAGLAILFAGMGFPHAEEAGQRTITGTAQVLDTDTLLVGDREVRLYGISAPRLADWPWGPFARAALDSFAHGKQVNCLVVETDRNHRPVARCLMPGDNLVGDKTLGEAMIRAGWATHQRLATHGRAGTDMTERYDDAEDDARARKVGIWGLK